MKALFCTDGSEISFYALDNIDGYCSPLEIDILCVVDWTFYPMYMSYPEQDFINTYDELADKILEEAANMIETKGHFVGIKKKAWGSASEEIVHQTEKTHYDLILLGSHGKKGIKNWLGSVSRQVVNHVKEPVFVSKEACPNKKVLLTADGSDGSKYALKKAIELLKLDDKEISIITVMEDAASLPIEITSNSEWFNDYLSKRNCFAQNVIRETQAYLKEHNLCARNEYSLIGAPSSTIIETAKRNDIDLIVMGSRSKDKFSEVLLGSTSKRVLEKTRSSVLIISPPKENSQQYQ